ncbi:MAG: aldose 1-epimerase family protein, partial [Erysipelotrichaceae bacterium]|nr:aldose 1-epimerase family protein [Erysipelotrichaceae bacterium]
MSEEKTVKLENEFVEAVISSQAAEVISFKRKDNGIEMVWNRDPQYWTNCNPILFPYYSKLKDGRYTIDGRTIELGQHGFARRAVFKFEDHDATSCQLVL